MHNKQLVIYVINNLRKLLIMYIMFIQLFISFFIYSFHSFIHSFIFDKTFKILYINHIWLKFFYSHIQYLTVRSYSRTVSDQT